MGIVPMGVSLYRFLAMGNQANQSRRMPHLHANPDSKLSLCPHYNRGFCPLGPLCAKRHIRRVLCGFYLAGFCPDGPDCKNAHPRFPSDSQLGRPELRVEKTEEEREEAARILREKMAEEEERERERWMAEEAAGMGGRGRGRGRGRWGGGRGAGQRSQRGRGHY